MHKGAIRWNDQRMLTVKMSFTDPRSHFFSHFNNSVRNCCKADLLAFRIDALDRDLCSLFLFPSQIYFERKKIHSCLASLIFKGIMKMPEIHQHWWNRFLIYFSKHRRFKQFLWITFHLYLLIIWEYFSNKTWDTFSDNLTSDISLPPLSFSSALKRCVWITYLDINLWWAIYQMCLLRRFATKE